MIIGSFVVFAVACLLLLIFPPFAFLAWLASVVMFFVGMSARNKRNAEARASKQALANSRECPHCKSPIRRDASVCPHCQRESAPWVFHEGRWWTKHNGKDFYSDATGQWIEFDPQRPSSGQPSSAP